MDLPLFSSSASIKSARSRTSSVRSKLSKRFALFRNNSDGESEVKSTKSGNSGGGWFNWSGAAKADDLDDEAPIEKPKKNKGKRIAFSPSTVGGSEIVEEIVVEETTLDRKKKNRFSVPNVFKRKGKSEGTKVAQP